VGASRLHCKRAVLYGKFGNFNAAGRCGFSVEKGGRGRFIGGPPSKPLILWWTIGLYLMWLTTNLQLPLTDTPEIPRGWRAVIYLGEILRQDFEQHGIDADRLTDGELRRQITKRLRGGKVQFKEPLSLTHPGHGFRNALWEWLAKSKAAFAILLSFAVTIAALVPTYLWQQTVYVALLIGLGLGVLWAIIFGYSIENRLLLVAAVAAASLLVFIPQFLKS